MLILCVLAAAAYPAEIGPVVVVPIRTEISGAQFFFLRRALKNAERQHASALVLDMETYGGDVKAAIDSMDALLKTQLPTFTYVNNKAISAGAMIALATQHIYMSPTAVIGAAAPVQSSGEDLSKTMADKTVSALSAMARAASQKNGHNAELADAFINKEKEVKIGDVVIDRSDSLLTLSADEATRIYNDKPLLADGVAGSLEAMLQQAGLTGVVERVTPSGFEQMAFWITAVAPLLLLGGIIGGYIEIKTPGFGIPGLISLTCFALFFAGHYIAGLAGWEVVVCFAIGVALVLGELLLHPGTVLPGVAGVLMMLGALIWAMIDRYSGQPVWPTEDMLLRPLINLSLAVVGAGILIGMLAKVLPQTPIYRRMALVASLPPGGVEVVPDSVRGVHVGENGIAKTMLRPSGKAEFGGHAFVVVSAGDFIEVGAPVRVVSVEGARVVVEAA
jgi:membrane-bound serine protease (ClpP class)